MQSNFTLRAQNAREAIEVPALPLATILQQAQIRPEKSTARRGRAVLAAFGVSISIVAAAAAAQIFGHVQVVLRPSGTINLYLDSADGSWGPIQNPAPSDFAKAVRSVNFPVILPAGLPRGTQAEELAVIGSGVIQIAYNLPGAWRRSNHLLFVMLVNPKSIASGNIKPVHRKYSLSFVGPKVAGRWMAGREEVIVQKSTLTAAELAHFKAVMTAH